MTWITDLGVCVDCAHLHVDADGDGLCKARQIPGNLFPGDDSLPWAAMAEDMRRVGAECGPQAVLFQPRANVNLQ